MSDRRRHAPATERNREPILAILRRVLPECGSVLEIAAGTGEHAVFFAAAFPGLEWQPTDADADCLDSIAARVDGSATANLRPPVRLDVTEETWPITGGVDAIFNANMIHIAPWQACLGLMRGAGRLLPSGGVLVLYGPYRIEGAHTAPSNAAFDADLRSRNPDWGVRDLEEVIELAQREGLDFDQRVAMPANNQTVVFRHR